MQSQKPTGAGSHFQEIKSQRKQLERGTHAVNRPGQTWDNRNIQGSCNFSNGNIYPSGSSRGPQLSSANKNAAFSDSVADNMFGSSYWQASSGEPQHSHCATGNNTGSQYGQAYKQDPSWGEWTDPGAKCNLTKQPSWSDSRDYQQTDIPWTDEPRKATSLLNHSKPRGNCSASQTSLRGSVANSAERSSLKEPQNRVGRSSPMTWQSEETASDTMHALDNFEDVSTKVQEWLNNNESSGLGNPPGQVKPKRSRKKRKKTAVKKNETQVEESKTLKDIHVDKGDKISYQGKENITAEKKTKNFPDENQFIKLKTTPTTTKQYHATNNKSSQLLPCSVKIDDKPKGSNSSQVGSKPFFDPRIIFNSSDTSEVKPTGATDQKKGSVTVDSTKRIDVDYGSTNTNSSSKESEGQHCNITTGVTQRGTCITTPTSFCVGDQSIGWMSSQKTGAHIPDREPEQNRRESTESLDSETAARMTEAEWRDIINSMYVPLGISPKTSPDRHETTECTSKITANVSCNQSSEHQNCDVNLEKTSCKATSNASLGSRMEAHVGKSTIYTEEQFSGAGNSSATRKEKDNTSQAKYVNVKGKLKAGILKHNIPVCHAGASITSIPLPVNSINGCLGSTLHAKCSPSCHKSLAKTSVASTLGESIPSEDKICHPTKPVPEPIVIKSSEPFSESSKVTASKLRTTEKDRVGSEETNGSHVKSEQDAPAKKPSKQSTKTMWEPLSESSVASTSGKSIPSEDKLVISSAPSSDSSKVTASKLKTTEDPVGSEEINRSHVKSEQDAPAKKPSKQSTNTVWEPLSKSSVASTCGKSIPSEDKINCPTKPIPDPKLVTSSAPSSDSSKVTASKLRTTEDGVDYEETNRSHVKSELHTPTKKPSKQSTKAFWEPSRIFSYPSQGGVSKTSKVSVNGSCVEPNTKAEVKLHFAKQTTNLKTAANKNTNDNSRIKLNSETRSRQSSAEACSAQPKSSQGKDSTSSNVKPSNYSYTEWKKQNLQSNGESRENVDLTHVAAGLRGEPTLGSNTRSAAELPKGSKLVQDHAGIPETKNWSQNNAPAMSSETPKGNISEMLFAETAAAKDSTRTKETPTSNKQSQSTSNPTTTHKQGYFNCADSPKNNSRQSPEFGTHRENLTNNVPNKHDENQKQSKRPSTGESKTKSKSATNPESCRYGPKQTEANPSNMNSKVHEGHTAQSSKHPSSASRKTQPQASSRTTDENIDPRQRRDQQDAPAPEIDIEGNINYLFSLNENV